MSLRQTLPFTTGSGGSGLVVSPGAWVFHKGLTFPRRKSSSKQLKDLYGIWYVLAQLGALSAQSLTEVQALATDYPRWFQRFRTNLKRWIADASPNDWADLESQDPAGHLKRSHLIHTLESLINENGR